MTSWPGADAGEPVDPNPAGYAPAPAASGYSAAYPPPPGYVPYGYPPQGYGAPGYGYPGYGYPGYGYPGFGAPAPQDVRPGVATTSAVLAFVTSGLLILAGLLLLLGGALAGDIEDSVDSGTHIGLELALDGLVNLVAGGLLIAGGALLLSRKANGRLLLSVGGGIVVAAAVYWTVRFDDLDEDNWTFDAALFVVLVVLTLIFAWLSPVTRWLRRSG